MPGRVRTASSPLRTWICPASYFDVSSEFLVAIVTRKTAQRKTEDGLGTNLLKLTGQGGQRNAIQTRQPFLPQHFRGVAGYGANSHRIRRIAVRPSVALINLKSSGSSSDSSFIHAFVLTSTNSVPFAVMDFGVVTA